MTRHFKHRLLLSILGFVGLFICIYLSFIPLFKPIFILIVSGMVGLALHEFYDLCKLKGCTPLEKLGIGAAIAYLISLPYTFHHPALSGIPALILLISFLIFFLVLFNNPQSSLSTLGSTIFGFVYLAIPLSCILRINYFFPTEEMGDGRLWLAYVFIVSKMTDIGGYIIGKCYGKTQLTARVSPKKTVEGSLGGTIAALMTSLIFALVLPIDYIPFKITLWQSVWLGLLISVLAQLGDLSESLLKRDAGVKDSSHLPGLGGMLDIVDSLVFTLPLMYLMLKMHLVG